MAQRPRVSVKLNSFKVAFAILMLAGCDDRAPAGLHTEIVSLDDLGTPGWRTGPGEAESESLLNARSVLAARWFPSGVTTPQAIRTLRQEGYEVFPLFDDGFTGGRRYGRGLCQPGTEVHLYFEDNALRRAEVRTFPAVTFMGGVIC